MTQTTDRASDTRPPAAGRRRARHRQPAEGRASVVVRGVAVGVVVILAAAGILLLGDQIGPQDPARVTAGVETPAGGVMPQERFVVSGSVDSGFVRPVNLLRRDGAEWTRVAEGRTGPGGAFSFDDVRADSEKTQFRVQVPAVDRAGQSHPEVSHAVPQVRVVPQEVTEFSVLPGIAQPGEFATDANEAQLVGHAAFTPIRQGREVSVQRRLPGGGWERVASATQGAEGKVRFQFPQDVGSPHQFRVVALPHDGAPARPSKAQASNRWQLDLDPRWSTRGTEHAAESNRTCARADPSMVVAGGGVVDVSVARDPEFAPGTCSWKNAETGDSGTGDYYLNGHIGTQGVYSFRYGVAAARVKFQQPRGMHGSFWLQDSGEAEGTVGAEIDTVEFFGRGFSNGGIATFVHPTVGEEVGGTQPDAAEALTGPRDNWWDRYHVFSVEWTPEEYVFRVDGVETLRTDKNVADRKVFVILSLLTSDWELDKMPEAGTGTMRVDWVRVWQDARLADLNL